jgi:hypothetical protein
MLNDEFKKKNKGPKKRLNLNQAQVIRLRLPCRKTSMKKNHEVNFSFIKKIKNKTNSSQNNKDQI